MKNKKTLLCVLSGLLVVFLTAGCAAVPQNEERVLEFDEDFFFSAGLDENGFWQGIRALDYLVDFDYRAIQIPAHIHYVSEESVQDIIDDILANSALTERVMDAEVVHGDTINIDFVGSVDGVEFAGGSTGGAGMDVTIGETQFIDDFLYQLIGHMPGATVNVEVTFPDDYFEASLQGAEALFITTINYIVKDVVPELTDAFVLENIAPHRELSTVDELLEDIRSFLRENAARQYLEDYLSERVAVRYIPERLIIYHEQVILHQYAHQGMQFGMDLEAVLSMLGFDSVEDFLEHSHEEIEREARFTLVLQAIAEEAGITVSIQEVADFFAENFNVFDLSTIEEIYGLPWLKQFVRNQMVMDYVVERVVLA